MDRALSFAQGLLSIAAEIVVDGDKHFTLSMGMHSGPTHGVVMGISQVLGFVGALPHTASQLQAACPPNCLHVSQQVRASSVCTPRSVWLGVSNL